MNVVNDCPAALCQPDADLDALTASARHRRTGPVGEQVAWSIWGEGVPMVLLHGAHGSWQHFVRNIAAFARHHLVLVPDLPGYGASDAISTPCHIAALTDRVADGLDAIIGPDTLYIAVGFSFGGAVTADLILRHAGRLRHTVVAASAGIAAPGNPTMVSVRHRRGDDLVAAHHANLCSIMFAHPECVTPQALRIQHEGTMQSRLPVGRVDYGRGLRDALVHHREPLLGIWGDNDSFFAPGDAENRPQIVRDQCPHAETIVLPGVGHWVQYEGADDFNRLVLDFVAR